MWTSIDYVCKRLEGGEKIEACLSGFRIDYNYVELYDSGIRSIRIFWGLKCSKNILLILEKTGASPQRIHTY
jgi:hypothetical protein